MTEVTKIKSLLLDLDGTVVDTHELIYQCYDKTMRQHCGCQGSRHVLEQCTGMHLRDIFTATLAHSERPVSDQLLTEAIAIYREHLRANEASVSTFPGMRQSLIEFVRRGWKLGIVTTKHSVSAHRHLQSQELTQLFDVVIAGDQCTNIKPHPEPFIKALEALGLAPGDAIGIGDSEHDIHSARAAGMMTVGACWGALSRGKLLAAKPDFVAEKPEDLLGIQF
jgi:pyrophosphatase PpaX